MSLFITQIEQQLSNLAESYTQQGSDLKAVIHHWAHAIAAGSTPIGEPPTLEIIKTLQNAQLYTNKDEFRHKLYSEIVFPPPSAPKFHFIDLFAGIGGFRLALQEANGACVFSSEWDRSAQQTYFNNYGELPFGDIRAFTNDNISDELLNKLIPTHEILAGGFPCQPFSHAGVSARSAVGKQHGFECKTQGTLFFDIMRIASVKRPKVLLLENVRNIQSHDQGRTFNVIKSEVEELGYDFKFKIIDASTLVPQRRLRCYMVCLRKDLNVNFEFPDFTGNSLPLRTILEENPPSDFTISDRLWQGHINRTQRNLERGTGFTAFTADIDKPSNTLVARYGKDGKECLIPQEGKNPRLLTPRECARLQGYPDKFVIPKAKTPAYKQFGNSIAVPVVSKIVNKLIMDLI
ncbi:DNA (cytosine-5-)-methyltransferase [Chitinibacter sp. ZOR0017]|uniref:DNA (cytosine-5-)-methyltransferase n=1 Tax=Chitinibacter sp. ZOR0017 TaxID=1339254 RepID=UPI000647704B|nr:DNA (cytosine-5-)-methyltransferase [Chitinibacter sp. ZOR0017]